jgi:hypothetical protein
MNPNNSLVLRLIGIIVFIVTFSVCFVLYQTLANNEVPVEDIRTDYTYTKTRDFFLVTSLVATEADESFVGNISKIFINKNTGYQIEINVGDVVYTPGSNSVHRTYVLPLSTPSGTYCVKTIMRWRPIFSLVDKKNTFEHGCFALND